MDRAIFASDYDPKDIAATARARSTDGSPTIASSPRCDDSFGGMLLAHLACSLVSGVLALS